MCKNFSISEHAHKRIKERMGINRKAARRLIPIVYDKGLKKDTARGILSKYMERKSISYRTGEEKSLIAYGAG